MTNIVANGPKHSVKLVKKDWLYVAEIAAVAASSGSGWNDGYLPSNKFLYFSEAITTSPEKELKKTSWLN